MIEVFDPRQRVRAVALALAAACALGSASCGGKSKGGRDPRAPALLRFIPADTPYVIASLEPLPTAYFERQIEPYLRHGEKLTTAMLELRRQHPELMSGLGMEYRVIVEAMAELKGHMSLEGLRQLGIDLRGRWAVYGIGFVPVLRFEVSDPETLRATIVRILNRAGFDPAVRRAGKREYWSVMLTDAEVAIAFVDNALVATVVTPTTRDVVLPLAFGDRKPAQSLADTGELQSLARTHGFASYTIGYFDLVAAARTLVGDSDPVANQVTQALGIAVREPACVTELPSLAATMPRVAFGIYSIDERQSSGALVVELRKDTIRALEAMRAVAPAMRSKAAQRARVAVGVGVDTAELLVFASKLFRQITTSPYRCSHLAMLNSTAAEIQTALMAFGMSGSPLASVRGMSLLLDELAMAGSIPTKLRGMAFVGANDPIKILEMVTSMGGMSMPAVTAGGPPQRLALPGFGASLIGDVFVAIKRDALGVSIGFDTGVELSTALGAPSGRDEPLLSGRLDGAFALELDRMSGDDDYSELESLSPEAVEALRELDRSEYEDVEWMTFSVDVNEHGVVGSGTVKYKPLGRAR